MKSDPAELYCMHSFSSFVDKLSSTVCKLSTAIEIKHYLLFQVTPNCNFQKDLGLDSLDTVEVVMAFEEEFAVEIPDVEADKILSTADAIEYLASHPQAK